MTENSLDWLMVGIVVLIFTIALFFGFGPQTKHEENQINVGTLIARIGFLIYGGAGLLRKRILFGNSAFLLRGFWAILASIAFIAAGCFGIFEYVTNKH